VRCRLDHHVDDLEGASGFATGEGEFNVRTPKAALSHRLGGSAREIDFESGLQQGSGSVQFVFLNVAGGEKASERARPVERADLLGQGQPCLKVPAGLGKRDQSQV